MRVVCSGKTGKCLSAKYLAALSGETEQTEYDVSVGKEYEVFGVAVWRSIILLLLLDDGNLPDWYPVELFSVADAQLPEDWFFSVSVANEHGVEAIWGYDHLVRTPSHYEALLERDPSALRMFFKERWQRAEVTERS